MNLLTKIAIGMLFLGVGEAQAASCRMIYSFPCKGGSLVAPALHWIANVNCATGALLSSSQSQLGSCEVDYSRNYSLYQATYFCSELGYKKLPSSSGLYTIVHRSSGGGYVRHACDINLPQLYNF